MQPLAVVQSRQRLLGGSDEILIQGLVLTLGNLVQLLIELLQLCGLSHEFLQHELWGLVRLVAPVEQELQSIVNQSQVQEETVASQAVSSVSNNLHTTLRVIAIQTGQNLVVRKAIGSV